MARADGLPPIFDRLEEVCKTFAPSPCVVVVFEGEQAHVNVEVPDTDDPQQIYDAGQKALFTLAAFLERYRPVAERAAHEAAHRNTQSS
jgi:hypothetical protein